MKKKIVSVLLALALCLSLVPVSALAQEADIDWSGETVVIDGKEYENAGELQEDSFRLPYFQEMEGQSAVFRVGDGFIACSVASEENRPASLSIILNNVELVCKNDVALMFPDFANITMELRGTNRLVGSGAPAIYGGSEDASGEFRFTGSGSLTAESEISGLYFYGTYVDGGVRPSQLNMLVTSVQVENPGEDNFSEIFSYWVYGNAEVQHLSLYEDSTISFVEGASLKIVDSGVLEVSSLRCLQGGTIVNNGVIYSEDPTDNGTTIAGLGITGTGIINVFSGDDENDRHYTCDGAELSLINYLELVIGQESGDGSLYTWKPENGVWTLSLAEGAATERIEILCPDEFADSPNAVIRSAGKNVIAGEIIFMPQNGKTPCSLTLEGGPLSVKGSVYCWGMGSQITVAENANVTVSADAYFVPFAVAVGDDTNSQPDGESALVKNPAFKNGSLIVNGKLTVSLRGETSYAAISAGNVTVGSKGELTASGIVGVAAHGTEYSCRQEQLGPNDSPWN